MRRVLEKVGRSGPLLDVGCGPTSWLWGEGLNPTGVDLIPNYVEAFNKNGRGKAVVGSCDALPFDSKSFFGVWCIGVLHHLDDEIAKKSISEMLRVCKSGGYVCIFDAVLPRSFWVRPLAYAIRKADRGGNVRLELAHRALFSGLSVEFDRHSISYTGLESISALIGKT